MRRTPTSRLMLISHLFIFEVVLPTRTPAAVWLSRSAPRHTVLAMFTSNARKANDVSRASLRSLAIYACPLDLDSKLMYVPLVSIPLISYSSPSDLLIP